MYERVARVRVLELDERRIVESLVAAEAVVVTARTNLYRGDVSDPYCPQAVALCELDLDRCGLDRYDFIDEKPRHVSHQRH
jgi:hypothetical protein